MALLIMSVLAAGCVGPGSVQRQVERTAKDWCLVVRASQVIPVYPLTEDVVPGDVFLVDVPREEQAQVYAAKGFLPLDHHLVRIRPDSYDEFYLKDHGLGGTNNPPYVWTHPSGAPGNSNELAGDLAKMPMAAFPSYSFSIKRGGGFNLALPIQGVPVALNALHTSDAQGSVILDGAATYGVDESSLAELIYGWAAEYSHVLTAFAPTNGHTNYLRVVNRVYLVKSVTVNLTANAAGGIAGSAGADKAVNIPGLTGTNAATNFQEVVTSLNATVSDVATPGGSFKFTSASSRAVSMHEEFKRPLVIGYIGYDVPILDGGKLGGYTSTGSALKGSATRVSHQPVAWGTDPNTERIRTWIKLDPAKNRATLIQWLKGKAYPYGDATTYFESGLQYSRLRKQFKYEVIEKPW